MHAQSTLPDGRVLVAGGSGTNCYVYTPGNNTWIEVASLPVGIAFQGQSALVDGRVLVSGVGSVYIYSHDNNTWTEVASMSASVSFQGQSTLNDGRVFVTGGNSVNTTYIYTPDAGTGTWVSANPMPTGFRGHGQSTYVSGLVLISGGWNDTVGNLNNVYYYVPNDNAWAAAASLPARFHTHGQSTLADFKVMVSGGTTNGNSSGAINTAYIYTPSSNRWDAIASLQIKTSYLSQSTLADGRVLVSGGSDGNIPLNTAYIYTPAGWVAKSRHRKRSYFACQYIRSRSIHSA